jgi:uncharacterized protein YbjQ (UPF0145 family)
VAMVQQRKGLKADAAVGQESTPDGVGRSQTMAQVAVQATQAEIRSTELLTQSAILEVWC